MGEETGRTYACQLEDFGSQVLENRGYVHGSLGTDAHLVLGVLLEETLDTAAGKLARRSWSTWRHVARKDGRDESRRESGFRGLRASSSASPPAGHATSVERRSQGQVAGRRRRVVDASRRDSRCSCHRSLLGGRGKVADASNVSESRGAASRGGWAEGIAKTKHAHAAGVVLVSRRASPGEGRHLTCRPARAEWLCCFLWPSTLVLPPELLPPEDFPLPPGILDAGV